jgi:hypothetical protein
MSFQWRITAFLCITLIILTFVFFLPPIPQNPAYHHFKDSRSLFGIPNFADVLSNAPFLIAGIIGFLQVKRRSTAFRDKREQWPYLAFFLGIALTCFGSAYYHWSPDSQTLVWDRLPMSIAFMGILAGAISDRIGARAGSFSLFPLLCVGIVSVLYWYFSEMNGSGDLRPYAVVQFFTLAAIPLLFILFPARYTHSWWLLAGGGAYVLAKVFETFDRPIFDITKISGHTLKHLAAALTAFCVIQMLRRRNSVQ